MSGLSSNEGSCSSKETLQQKKDDEIDESLDSEVKVGELTLEDDHLSEPTKLANSTSITIIDLDGGNVSLGFGDSQDEIARKTSSRSKKKERLERPLLPVTNLFENVVGWDGQMDPEMPLNFSQAYKWWILGLTGAINLMVAFASSMIAPGISLLSEEFHNTSDVLDTLAVTMFLLGFTVGPLILSPLSEMYGRKSILTCGNVFFLAWQIGCALAPNMSSFILFRFLGGMGGSASFTIGGGLISDLFDLDMRGTASSIYALGTLIGPVFGPVCGGFIAKFLGWRWNFWILTIPSSILTLATIFSTRETNHHVLIQWKVDALRKQLSNASLYSCYERQACESPPRSRSISTSMLVPLRLLLFSPIIFILALYSAFVYGMQYVFSTTIPAVFHQTYHWSTEYTGLAYLGLGLGFLIGALTVARINDTTVVRLTKSNGGVSEPEMRLPACIFFACLIPVSFFWYGWSTARGLHWSIPIIGLVPFGIGQIGVFVPIQTYVIDSFPSFAASGFAAVAVMRSLLGAMLPLAGPAMYATLGLGWGNTVFGIIAIALIPLPLLIFKFGEKLRKAYPIRL